MTQQEVIQQSDAVANSAITTTRLAVTELVNTLHTAIHTASKLQQELNAHKQSEVELRAKVTLLEAELKALKESQQTHEPAEVVE